MDSWARNPAALVARPGVPRTEASDATAVLRAAPSSRYHAALMLIGVTGLRKGECPGLSWHRVDLDGATLKVAATIARVNGRLTITEPKTDRARRTIPLSPRWWRCCAATLPSRRRRGCGPGTSGSAAGWCSPPNWALRWRLATTALHNAVARRGEVAGCVLHTDRGSQFRSRKFVHARGRQEMVGSMGESGLPATTPPSRASSACCKRTCWTATDGTPARNYASRSSPRSNAPTTVADARPASDG